MVSINNNLSNSILNSLTTLKKAVDDSGVIDAKKAAASPTPTTNSSTSNLSASDNLNYLANSPNTLSVSASLTQSSPLTLTDKLKLQELSLMGITVGSTDHNVISKINFSVNITNGAVTVSGINGNATSPTVVNVSKVKGFNSVNFTNSSNVTINTNPASKSSTTIGSSCKNVETTEQRTADIAAASAKAKTDLLKSCGVTLSTTDVSTINNISITKDAKGIVTLSGINGTSASLINVNIAKTNGVNGVTISNSTNATVVSDSASASTTTIANNCTNVKTAAQRTADDKVAALKTLGISVNTTDVNTINNITYSKSTNGIVTVSGINGTVSNLLQVSVSSAPNVRYVIFDNSSNTIINTDKNTASTTMISNHCSNVKTADQIASEKATAKVAQLASYGITLSTTDVNVINSITVSKGSNGIVNISGVNGSTTAPITMNLSNSAKVNITNSQNVSVVTDKTATATQDAASCKNVSINSISQVKKSALEALGLVINTPATDANFWEGLTYKVDGTYLTLSGASSKDGSVRNISVSSSAKFDSLAFSDDDTKNINVNVDNSVNNKFYTYITSNKAENITVTLAKDNYSSWIWTNIGAFDPIKGSTVTISSLDVQNRTVSFPTQTNVRGSGKNITATNGVVLG